MKDNSREIWKEHEIRAYLKRLKPLTIEFMKLLSKKGSMESKEIIKELKLKGPKSVSALVSACIRNSPLSKEKIIFKDEKYIKINEKYRDIIFNILKNNTQK